MMGERGYWSWYAKFYLKHVKRIFYVTADCADHENTGNTYNTHGTTCTGAGPAGPAAAVVGGREGLAECPPRAQEPGTQGTEPQKEARKYTDRLD